MEIGLARAGHAPSRLAITDLDLVAGDLEVVSPGVGAQFLISHYHVPQPDAPAGVASVFEILGYV